MEHPERDVILGRVSPEDAAWGALLAFILVLVSPPLGFTAGLGAIALGFLVWWWEPDRWGRRAGMRVVLLGALAVVVAIVVQVLLPW